jgi:hypothetical protein
VTAQPVPARDDRPASPRRATLAVVPPPVEAPPSGRRPEGRGRGLDGPACPERAELPQSAPTGGPPYHRMCIRCGRVTARSDVELVAWCGGEFRVLPLAPWMRPVAR